MTIIQWWRAERINHSTLNHLLILNPMCFFPTGSELTWELIAIDLDWEEKFHPECKDVGLPHHCSWFKKVSGTECVLESLYQPIQIAH